MSGDYVIARKCGTIYTGYLFPGDSVWVDSVIVNTATGRMRANVWSAHTLTVAVPVGSVVGLAAAVKAGTVRVYDWTPGTADTPFAYTERTK